MDIASRLARLEAIEAIRTLKAHYAALADQKYTMDYARQPDDVMRVIASQQAACFTEHAVWAGGAGFGGDLVGRSALCEWFLRSPWRFAAHFYGGDHIDVIDDRSAHATWRLWQLALRDDDARAVLLASSTVERYERGDDDAWRISYMRFEPIHMLETGVGPAPIAATFAGLDAIRAAAFLSEHR